MKNRLIFALIASVILSGCLVPERFKAAASFESNGSYSYSYEGTAVHGFAAMQLAKTGTLSRKDTEGLEREVTKLKKNPDVRSASYEGNGRYAITLNGTRKPGQAANILSILTVKSDKEGVITLSSAELNEAGKKQLRQLRIQVNGTLSVTVPKNADVLYHNATSTPSLFGGTYSWKIGDTQQRPMIKIRIKS